MLTLADVERAIATRDPQLGDMLVRYLEQPDPDPGKSELSVRDDYDDWDDDDDHAESPFELDEEVVEVPPGAFTFDRLRDAMADQALSNKTPPSAGSRARTRSPRPRRRRSGAGATRGRRSAVRARGRRPTSSRPGSCSKAPRCAWSRSRPTRAPRRRSRRSSGSSACWREGYKKA